MYHLSMMWENLWTRHVPKWVAAPLPVLQFPLESRIDPVNVLISHCIRSKKPQVILYGSILSQCLYQWFLLECSTSELVISVINYSP